MWYYARTASATGICGQPPAPALVRWPPTLLTFTHAEHRPQPSLDRLVQAIVEKTHPLRIVLFSSGAKGAASADSDIDLLVVVPDGTHRRHTAQRLYREIVSIGLPFDLVVATASDIERHADNPGLVYRSALREGRQVYAA